MLTPANPPPGWTQPVYQGMREGATFYGVPFLFGAVLALGMLLCLLWYYPLVPVGLVLWGIAALGTALEPRWVALLLRHGRYRRHYEG